MDIRNTIVLKFEIHESYMEDANINTYFKKLS